MRPDERGRLAREKIDVPWDELRSARGQRAVVAELRGDGATAKKRLRARVFLAAIAACFVVLAIGLFRMRPSDGPRGIAFADGTMVVPDSGAHVVPLLVTNERIEIEHTDGGASYDVVHRPERPFVVHAGSVTIEVLGTAFRVERRSGSVKVSVLRGSVRASRGERTMVLGENDSITLAEDEAIAEGASAADPPPPPPTLAAPSAAASVAAEETNASGAGGGSAASQATEAPSAADLFRQADDARARGDSGTALKLLRDLLQRYPRDGRATMALFTIGRLERKRGHAADAARAFEACGDAMSGEALAEAALARSAAGEGARAKGLAERYLSARPSGARAAEMVKLAR